MDFLFYLTPIGNEIVNKIISKHYIIKENAPDISNMVLVPKQQNQAFGSLIEIQARPDEILVSAATDNILILSNITAGELNLLTSQVVSKTSE